MKVLLIILILLFLILICPVGAAVRYSAEGVSLKIIAGLIKIRILPKKKKKKDSEEADEKSGKKKKKKKSKKKEKADKDQKAKKGKKEKKKQKEDSDEQEKPKEKLGGKIEFFRQLLGVGLDALGCLRRKLILRDLVLYLTVGGKPDDAAGSAILYGRAWAAIGALTPVLENTFRIKNRDMQAFLDYTREDTTVYAEGTIVIRIGSILWIAIYYGVKVLKIFLKRKRSKKSKTTENSESSKKSIRKAADKNGSSDQ